MIKIAIDGPSGSGKSTLAKALAKKMGYVYVDTGALYRTVGLYMLGKGIADDREKIIKALDEIVIKLTHNEEGKQEVYLNDKPVGDSIRTTEVAKAASFVSAIPEVRRYLLDTQRSISYTNNVIMDGRDIGTVIFPDAQVKIFLTAGNLSRAKRRHRELLEKGENITLEQVLADMEARDTNDRTRKEAPAVPASDAVMLDNSEIGIEETVNMAYAIIRAKIR